MVDEVAVGLVPRDQMQKARPAVVFLAGAGLLLLEDLVEPAQLRVGQGALDDDVAADIEQVPFFLSHCQHSP